MAARKRAQAQDYNRRRHLILDKGFEMAYNQKDTAFGLCLLDWNVKEATQLERRQKWLQRQEEITASHKDQEKRKFIIHREEATREPTLILERTPTENQFPSYVDYNQPRFMRQLDRNQTAPPEFPTFSAFQAVKKRKQNLWQDAVQSKVMFRPTLCPTAKLSDKDVEELSSSWAQVNEIQTKALGKQDTTRRSVEATKVHANANPLLLPPSLNAMVNLMASQCMDDLPPSTVSDNLSDMSSDEGDNVFITQFHGTDEVSKRRYSKKKNARRKQRQEKIDTALVGIYEYLNRSRIDGNPTFRKVNQGKYREKSIDTNRTESELSEVDSYFMPRLPKTAPIDRNKHVTFRPQLRPQTTPKGEFIELETTCRTAESIKILQSVFKKKHRVPSSHSSVSLACSNE